MGKKLRVNVVFISDYKLFETVFEYLRSKTTVDMYNDPETFLESLSRYDKDTRICIENSLKTKIGSFELAERLYIAGYTKLYLLSGWDFKNGDGPRELPHYLTPLHKGANIIEELDKLL
ncbi:hypothetical protein GAMM_220016 [Gammaproteobacteria bacterium]